MGAGGSQYRNALAFLRDHRGDVALVTIGIGGNDVVDCANAPDPATCFLARLPVMKKNLAYILAGLRAAAGPGVPIVGMNIYNPFAGDWLAPGPSRRTARLGAVRTNLLSMAMGQTFTAAGSPTADVEGAYQALDMTHFVSSSWGRVPVAVKRACTLLDIVCHVGQPEGFGDDPNIAGAQVIATAFETVIGDLHPPSATAPGAAGS